MSISHDASGGTVASPLPLPLLTLATALAGAVAVYIVSTPSLGGYDVASVFSWHPVLLTAAVLLLAPVGLSAYGDGGALSRLLPAPWSSARAAHGAAMGVAAALAALGYAAGYIGHELSGKDHLALARGNAARTAHVWLGLLALAALAAQAAAGAAKALAPPGSPRRFAWHGAFGRAVWALSAAPIALAIYFRWMALGAPAAGLALALALAAAAWSVWRQ
jgi:hypothetical protein